MIIHKNKVHRRAKVFCDVNSKHRVAKGRQFTTSLLYVPVFTAGARSGIRQRIYPRAFIRIK